MKTSALLWTVLVLGAIAVFVWAFREPLNAALAAGKVNLASLIYLIGAAILVSSGLAARRLSAAQWVTGLAGTALILGAFMALFALARMAGIELPGPHN